MAWAAPSLYEMDRANGQHNAEIYPNAALITAIIFRMMSLRPCGEINSSATLVSQLAVGTQGHSSIQLIFAEHILFNNFTRGETLHVPGTTRRLYILVTCFENRETFQPLQGANI